MTNFLWRTHWPLLSTSLLFIQAQHALAFLVYYVAMVSMETKHRRGLCNFIQISSLLLLNICSGKHRNGGGGVIACTLPCSASAHTQNYKMQFRSEFLLFPLVN